MTADAIFMLVPAADVREGEPRIWCGNESALADAVRGTGHLTPSYNEEEEAWGTAPGVRWLEAKPRNPGHSHAIVRRPRVDTQPLNPGPRYVVVPSSEMWVGRPYAARTNTIDHDGETARELAAEYNAGRRIDSWTWRADDSRSFWLWAVIDTHDARHASPPTPAPAPVNTRHQWETGGSGDYFRCICGAAELDADLKKAGGPIGAVALVTRVHGVACGTALALFLDSRAPAPVGPSKPTDEEIVAAWEAVHRQREINGRPWALDNVTFGGATSSLADYRAARSRLLAARVAASAERERMRVLVDIDHEDYA